jgi:hypothetical protein
MNNIEEEKNNELTKKIDNLELGRFHKLFIMALGNL